MLILGQNVLCIHVLFAHFFSVDISMSLSRKITQSCNKLHEATFYLPECRLLIDDGVKNSQKTCEEILDDVIADEEFVQEKHKSNRRLKSKQKVRNGPADKINGNFPALVCKKCRNISSCITIL
jgi:hypothetical protein